jgi:hypothetical protein
MTFTSWPSDVPWQALAEGYGERPHTNKASFQPEAGIAMERRRSSISSEDISYTSVSMTDDEWSELLEFYRDDLKDGTLPMERYHPRSYELINAKFTEAPAIVAVQGIHYLISIKLVRIP